MKKLWLLLVLLLVVGCEETVVKEVNWENYLDGSGFSIDHPDWNESEGGNESILSLSEAGCMVAVNKYDGSSEIMYDWLNTYLSSLDVDITSSDEDSKEIYYAAYHDIYLFYSKLKIYDCNDYAYNVMLACEQSLFNESEYSRLFDSVSCDESMKEEVDYVKYTDEDFSVDFPDWDITEQDDALVMRESFCNVYLFENEAGVDDVQGWLIASLDDYAMKDGILVYNTDYNGTTLKSEAGFNYCNYKTYVVVYTCVESVFDEEVSMELLDSLECAEVYEEIEEEPVEEVEEIVEEVEEIEEEVVGLVLPEEYGLIDPEWIVWFINSNDFFTYILEDYDMVNLILEDDVNFNIKADLVDGKIVHIEEGLHADGVSVYIPADDAVDILNSIDNINFVNFLVFAAKVRTEPVELKQEVINKILGI